MANLKRYAPEPASAPGDFYNVAGECVSCGVPHSVAPDLVGWLIPEDPRHCYWIKQPETPGELERAFAIFDNQEVGCHRYAGTDPLIQIRIGYENCDNPRAKTLQSSHRDLKRRGQASRSAAATMRPFDSVQLTSAMWGASPAPQQPEPGFLRRLWQSITHRS